MNKSYSFDDILLVPQFSSLRSRRDVELSSRISRDVTLRVPIIASYMDTVCEAPMATAMARLGGMGVIHRWMTIDEQVEEVQKVKRAENVIIRNPYSFPVATPLPKIADFMETHGIGGILITDEANRLKGIVTRRDVEFRKNSSLTARDVMTPRPRLVVGHPSTTMDEAMNLLQENRV